MVAYPAVARTDTTPMDIDWEADAATDTDTSSDDGQEPLIDDGTNFAGLSMEEKTELIFFQYRNAKRRWRRWTNKPVRKFRRNFKAFRRRRSMSRGGGGQFRSWSQRNNRMMFYQGPPTEA